MVLGNYIEDSTVLGTMIQIGLGIVGVDLACDLRDLSADIVNWEWSKEHVVRSSFVSAVSRHRGYHSTYCDFTLRG